MKPALLVLAAGMGSRYGGLKQIEALGPHGETLFDYAVFDALRAGFGKVVFVVRRDIEADFRNSVSRQYEDRVDVRYVHQELDMVPPGFVMPEDRRKPWGTAHATIQAAAAIDEPFAVINADDFYGRLPFEIIAGYLGKVADPASAGGRVDRYANVGYVLRDTLSDHGGVVRGVCQCDGEGMLQGIVETAGIVRDGDGARVTDDHGSARELSGDEIVSMNFWGFTPSVFAHFEERFARFLEQQGNDPGAEFFIPTVVDDLIVDGLAEVRMLHGGGPWFGVTYPEDAAIVRRSIQDLVDRGEYPSPLWTEIGGSSGGGRLRPATEFDLVAIGSAFELKGEMVHAERHGAGHINDTFAVTYLHGEGLTRYIHQRINRDVFADPMGLMENVRRVTSHLRSKLIDDGSNDLERRVLTLVPKQDGSVYHIDDEDWMWRTYDFIERAQTHDMVRSPDLAFEAAKAFGAFQRDLVDLPTPRLNDTIPAFHDTPRRFAALQAAVDLDAANRAAGAAAEIEFVARHEPSLGRLLDLHQAGEIPERVTHNDTKLNNVMIDVETAEGVCVIDLDTVMPGLSLFDFGDMVRTSTSFSLEDERDLSQVRLQMPLFEALVRGFLQSAGSFLNPVEIAEMVFAGKLITLEIGIRFLTDYLAGDTYFRTHREEHNLDRCRAQFRLVESINDQRELLEKVVEEVASERPWQR